MIPPLKEAPHVSGPVRTFARLLKKEGFEGDIDLRFASRLSLATDNSIYQLLPEAAIFPRSAADVSRIFSLATDPRFRHLSFAPRGGGTGTNGQSLTTGIVVDLSRYLSRIVNLDRERRTVQVEPGVVLDDLNRFLAGHGLFFAPTVSPSSRATLGGMVSTDACGKGSRIYGKTSDHIDRLSLVFADGSTGFSRRYSDQEIDLARSGSSLLARGIVTAYDMGRVHREDLLSTLPRLPRGVTGYNLEQALENEATLNLSRIIAGSEGTLAVVTEMNLNVLPLPPHRGLLLVGFGHFAEALESAHILLTLDPAAIETVDEKLLSLARSQKGLWEKIAPFLNAAGGSPEGLNMVEFFGETEAEVRAKLRIAEETVRGSVAGAVSVQAVLDGTAQRSLWEFRKKAVGLLGKTPGNRRPIPFIEDTAVPPEKLRPYIDDLRVLLDRRGLSYGMFGHIDAGCLHVRPALDLRIPGDAALIRTISDEVLELVTRYGGVFWGEHGKGFRSEFLRDLFGPALYPALQQIKGAFDPDHRLNPGKIVSPKHSATPPLKVHEPPFRGALDRQIAPDLEQEIGAAMYCNGNGQCFSTDPKSVMCPSSKVTRDRVHSPKGRSALLREFARQLSAHKDAAPPKATFTRKAVATFRKFAGEYDFSHEVYEGLHGCLSCKACATQCPVEVDVPRYKARFLQRYHSRYLRHPRDYAVAALETVAPAAAKIPRLTNLLVHNPIARLISAHLVGFVSPPHFAIEHAPTILGAEGFRILQREGPHGLSPGTVVLVPDAFSYFFEGSSFVDTARLLRTLGYQVVIAPFAPSGKPLHVKGFLERFGAVARRNAEFFEALSREGAILVGIEPSVVLCYRDEYRDALGETLEFSVALPHEFLSAELDREQSPIRAMLDRASASGLPERSATLFLHCSETTALPLTGAQWQSIFRRFGVQLKIASVGCCGMAGVFGHEAEHQKESRGIFEMSWREAIRAAQEDHATPVATGYSCRSQVSRLTGSSVRYPLQLLFANLPLCFKNNVTEITESLK